MSMISTMPAVLLESTAGATARMRDDVRVPEVHPHPGARINFLLKANYALWTESIGRALQPHGLSHGAYVMLLAMHSRPEWVASPSLLSGVIAETRTNTTRICDRLTRRGLVRRVGSTIDRRRVEVTLTAAGEALIATVEPRIDALLDRAYSIFTDAERATLESMLERLGHQMADRGAGSLRRHAPE